MANLDSDINMIPAGEASTGGEPSSYAATASSSTKKAKKFEIKKWNAVALWAWATHTPRSSSLVTLPQLGAHFVQPCPRFLALATLLLLQTLWWTTVLSAGTISWIFVSSAKPIKPVLQVRSVQLLGGSATMLSTSTASAVGSRLVKYAPWTIASGNFRSTVTRAIWG